MITVRVPDELRDKMKGFPDVNWSEVVRNAIERRIVSEIERRKKDRDAILAAGKRIDEIHRQLTEQHGIIDFDSSQIIRRWRDGRYGEP